MNFNISAISSQIFINIATITKEVSRMPKKWEGYVFKYMHSTCMHTWACAHNVRKGVGTGNVSIFENSFETVQNLGVMKKIKLLRVC